MKPRKVHARAAGARSLCGAVRWVSEEGKFSDAWEGVTCRACLRFRPQYLKPKAPPAPEVQAAARAFYRDMNRRAGA